MTLSLFLIQLLNGLQLGVLLFMLSAGLTLVFGIMNFVNLAHGCMYMMGAYFAATALAASRSFIVAAVVAVLGGGLLGIVIERLMAQHLYMRDHLDQVLATFGLILFFNELARWIWGASPVFMSVPPALSGTVSIMGVTYPTYRFFIILGAYCAQSAAGC